MASFLLIPHHGRELASTLALDTAEWLTDSGHRVYVLDEDARATNLNSWAVSDVAGIAIDLAVSLGGDGTMLRALDLVTRFGTPVLGVNVGHLGYLTEVEPEDLRSALGRFLTDDYTIEERMTIDVTVTAAPAADPTRTTLALSQRTVMNDVVVEKVSSGHTTRLEVLINDRPFLTYAVDGMIVATPTGSTAYNFSARGPVLSPNLDALLMTPVSPHMLFDRSMVLHGDETIAMRVIGREEASVVVDGRHVATLGLGGSVRCARSATPARILTFEARDFRQILKTKFGLTDR